LALILNRSNCTLCAPINLGREVICGNLGTGALGCGLGSGEVDEVFGGELVRSHIGEGVHFQIVGFLPSVVSFVVGLNIGEILQPYSQSISFLTFSGILLGVLEHPNIEGLLVNRLNRVEI